MDRRPAAGVAGSATTAVVCFGAASGGSSNFTTATPGVPTGKPISILGCRTVTYDSGTDTVVYTNPDDSEIRPSTGDARSIGLLAEAHTR
jgi:hypothetical protein